MALQTHDNWTTRVLPEIPFAPVVESGKKTELGEIVSLIGLYLREKSRLTSQESQQRILEIHQRALARLGAVLEMHREVAQDYAQLKNEQAKIVADRAIGISVPEMSDADITQKLADKWTREVLTNILSKKEYRLLEIIINAVTPEDLQAIADNLRDEAEAEHRAKAFPEGERTSEAPNEAIEKLIQEFFDKEILLLDTSRIIEGQLTPEQLALINKYEFLIIERDITDKTEREASGIPAGLTDKEKLQRIKRRYIESSVYSLLGNMFLQQLNPRTLAAPKFSGLSFDIAGYPKSFSTSEFVSRLTVTDDAAERAMYQDLSNEIQTAVFYLDEFVSGFQRVMHAEDSKGFIAAIPDSTESQYFDPARLKALAKIPPLQNRDVAMNRRWVFEEEGIGGERENLFHKLTKAAHFVFVNTRYADGFLPNTAFLDLSLLLGLDKDPDKPIENLVPSNWRIADKKGGKRGLITPLTFITPQNVRNDPDPDKNWESGKTELLPAAITAQPSTHIKRFANWGLIPDSIARHRAGDNPEKHTTQDHLAVALAHMWMELSHYSPNTDHALPLSEVGDDLTTRKVPKIEGKIANQKFNADIASKYVTGDEDVGRFGKINLAVRGTYGPVIVPDFFTYHVIQGVDPRNPGEQYVGSLRDWYVRAKGDPLKIPWEKLSTAATYEWTQARTHLAQLYEIGGTGDLGGDITALAEFKYKEGVVSGLNDKMLDNLANLSRLVKTYFVNTYADASKVARDAQEKDLWKTDFFARVIVRNARTGEITYVDTSVYQYYNMLPFRLMNQVPSRQISDIQDPVKNPKGRHYARYIPAEENPWEYAAQLAEESLEYKRRRATTPEQIAALGKEPDPAKWREIAGKNPRMPILVISVDPDEKGGMQEPNQFLAKDVFLGIIGAASSRGDIFKRMNRPQKVVFGLLFSQEVRDMFRYGYFQGVGQKPAREFVIQFATHLMGESGKRWAEKALLNEINPSSVLNNWFSYDEILRFFDGQFESRQTLAELLQDKEFKEDVSKLFGPIVGS